MKSRWTKSDWKDNFDEETYDVLIEYGASGNYKAWYKYLRKKKIKKIKLKGAILTQLNLSRFNLRNADLEYADLSFTEFNMTLFNSANLKEVRAHGADFTKAVMMTGNYEKANFASAVFNQTDCRFSNFFRSEFHESVVVNSTFDYSNIQKAVFKSSNLEKSSFNNTNLKGAELIDDNICSATFIASMVSGETIFWDCQMCCKTDLTGVGLENARVEPQMLSGFKNNIRRIWWSNYYENQRTKRTELKEKLAKHFLKNFNFIFKIMMNHIRCAFIKFFWKLTDYGSSIFALIKSFLYLIVSFSVLYTIFPFLNNTNDVISNASMGIKFIRNIYFSIVVMTSVGFGDIHANGYSVLSYLVISIQIILGYLLLGALLVRLGILFQDGLPEVESNRYEELKDKRRDFNG